MQERLRRRDFLGAVGALAPLAQSMLAAPATEGANEPGKTTPHKKVVIEPFDYAGVSLRPSFWQQQASAGRDFYFGLSNDDILHGYRVAAGMADAPGRTLGGWCSPNSNTVFGQWLQSMARMQRAYGDEDLLEKASILVSEYAKCWPGISRGEARGRGRGAAGGPTGGLGHYAYEKLAGGLLDMHHYAGHPDAMALCDKITEAAAAHFNRDRVPANRQPWELHSGRPGEWYTLGENLYRAYQLTGKPMYKEFAEVWLYPTYWDKFADNADPKDAEGVHAYSHCNSLSSAALAYDVTGDAKYLRILQNFYDWMQKRQTYASGGYGPDERFVFSDGALGDSLEVYSASFECPCDSWAAFKLSKYLLQYTGEARYGDWIERLLYNGIGAALRIKDRGTHMYYMDYHLGASLKYYSRTPFTCCSGTYFQNITEYSNLIYFKDPNTLLVNLYLPSEVEWNGPAGAVKLVQTTEYPEADSITLKLTMERPARFALKLRIPGWSNDATIQANGLPEFEGRAGQWAAITREWQSGDIVRVTIPLHFRRVPIDEQHPNRIAIVRGPVVYVQEDPHKWLSDIPRSDDELDRLMKPLTNNPAVFQIDNEPVVQQRNAFRPFYTFAELERYRMYFDSRNRRVLW
ncbi:MAG TPA: beta-L-arabinofuranosidase domain-containing protein [Bryobacteraceae bacterium]|nr:beta-L-arabinofuranosidase domain-containing protein [Bryobacteraceae bacterium]